MNDYLSLLGILQWFPRVADSDEIMYCYPLSQDQKLAGYLVMSANELLEAGTAASNLIQAILKSLQLAVRFEQYSLSNQLNFEANSLVIGIGELVKPFLLQLPPEINTLLIPAIEELLANPKRKKEIWMEIRKDFTPKNH